MLLNKFQNTANRDVILFLRNKSETLKQISLDIGQVCIGSVFIGNIINNRPSLFGALIGLILSLIFWIIGILLTR